MVVICIEEVVVFFAASGGCKVILSIEDFVQLFLLDVLLKPRTRVRFSAEAAAFLMEAKSENARMFEISAHVKDPLVVKVNPEPSTTRASLPV